MFFMKPLLVLLLMFNDYCFKTLVPFMRKCELPFPIYEYSYTLKTPTPSQLIRYRVLKFDE